MIWTAPRSKQSHGLPRKCCACAFGHSQVSPLRMTSRGKECCIALPSSGTNVARIWVVFITVYNGVPGGLIICQTGFGLVLRSVAEEIVGDTYGAAKFVVRHRKSTFRCHGWINGTPHGLKKSTFCIVHSPPAFLRR